MRCFLTLVGTGCLLAVVSCKSATRQESSDVAWAGVATRYAKAFSNFLSNNKFIDAHKLVADLLRKGQYGIMDNLVKQQMRSGNDKVLKEMIHAYPVVRNADFSKHLYRLQGSKNIDELLAGLKQLEAKISKIRSEGKYAERNFLLTSIVNNRTIDDQVYVQLKTNIHDEFHAWAKPLKENIEKIVRQKTGSWNNAPSDADLAQILGREETITKVWQNIEKLLDTPGLVSRPTLQIN